MKLFTACAECLSLLHCPPAMPRRPCKGTACLPLQYTCCWWTRLTHPLVFCHGTGLHWVEIPDPFQNSSDTSAQEWNSSRRANPRLSSTKYLGPKLPIISYNASSFQSMDRASSLCSCVVGYLHEVPGKWLWYTFWVFMRPISFLLHGERVHQMVQRCSNFKRLDKEQVLSTHYILNFIFY